MRKNFFEGTTYGKEKFKGLMSEYYPKKYRTYIKKKVLSIARKYSSGSNFLLIACTELSIILSESEFNSIDTMDILLDRILKEVPL